MNRKAAVPIIILFSIILLLAALRLIRLPLFPIHPHQAIPNYTSYFFAVEIEDFEKLVTEPSPLAKLVLPKNLESDFRLMQEVLGSEITFPNNKAYYVCVNPSTRIKADLLFIVPGMNGLNMKEIGKKTGWSSRTYQFDNQTLISLKKDGKECSFVTFRNLVLFAEHSYLVEDALNQLKRPATSICADKGFKKVNRRLAKEGSTFPLFLNFENFNAQFSPLLNASKFDQLAKLKQVGQWTLWNIPITGNPAVWTGAFVPTYDNEFFSASRKCDDPPSEKIWEAVPDNLSAVLALRVDEMPYPFLQSNQTWSGKEMVLSVGEPLENERSEQYLLVGAKDAELAEAALQNAGGGKPEKEYQLFRIWKIASANQNGIFGDDPTYAATLGEYVLFGNNLPGMERWLGKYIAGQTLSKNVGFLTMKTELPKDADLYFHVDGIKSWQLLAPFLNEKTVVTLGRNPIPFERVTGALKWKGRVGEITYAQPSALTKEKQLANILWSVPLLADAALQPIVQTDPQRGEMDIFMADKENRIYLISRSGRVLWRRELPEPILSQIFHINLNNDAQKQFAFNTKSAIYVVDRKGEDIGGFPLNLAVPASNGVTVVDFFQSNDYNFFIACENGKAYGFDEKGSPIEGWRPKEGIGMVEKPLLHFQTEGKDFLALLSESGKLEVFKKNGTNRFKSIQFESPDLQPLDYQASKTSSRIVTADREGKVYVANLVGDYFGLKLRVGNNEDVKFLFSDVTGDERKDYIALEGDEMVVYYYNGNKFEKAFTHQFPWPQDQVFIVKWERRLKNFIGTVNQSKRQLFLMDGNGRIPDQFPLAGSTPFVIVDLAQDGKPVVVTGNGPAVTAYVLE